MYLVLFVFLTTMGNMSSPSVNRWGYNLCWERYWFNDRIYPLFIQQDYIFNKLIYFFLFYGVYYPRNPFISKLFFQQLYNFKPIFFQKYNERYYRIIEIKDIYFNEIVEYNLRTRMKHLYYSKTWIFRFQHYLVISFYSLSSFYDKIENYYKKKLTAYNIKRKKTPLNKLKRIFYFYYFVINLLKNKFKTKYLF